MVKRIASLILLFFLFSFKGKTTHVHFINIDKPNELVVSNELMKFQKNTINLFDGYKIGARDFDLSNKEKITDSMSIRLIDDIFFMFNYDIASFQKSRLLSAYNLGDIKLGFENIEAKLICINITDKEDNRIMLLWSVNIINQKVVSVIELSRYTLFAGFSNYTYTILKKNKFRIVLAEPSCIATPNIKKDNYYSTIKMTKYGKFK